MPFSWNALHVGLRANIARHGFLTGFKTLTRHFPDLARFPEPQALLDYQRRVISGQTPDRDDIIRVLVRAAQGGGDSAVPAQTLLILALWPGLDAIRGRLRRFRLADDLGSDLVGALIDQVGRINLDRVNRVAATLLMNLERNLKRSWQAEATHLFDSYDDQRDLDETDPTHPAFGLVSCETVLDDHRRWHRVRQIIGADADLVRRVIVEGWSQAEAGRSLGLLPDAARKRFQRAMTRLAASQDSLQGAVPFCRPDWLLTCERNNGAGRGHG